VSGSNILSHSSKVADGNGKKATAKGCARVAYGHFNFRRHRGQDGIHIAVGLSASDRQQLRQRADDPIRLDGGFRG
jgi:hypothetical protein